MLRKHAKPVAAGKIRSDEIRRLIADMKATLKNTPDGVGLAAPQIGVSLRMFIVSEEAEEINKSERRWKKEDGVFERTGEKPYPVRDWRYDVYINPVAKNASRKKIEDVEGCLSVPGTYGTVDRLEKITVEAHDEHGKKFTRGASRFVARVIQHELDHLEGTLFIDKVGQWVEIGDDSKT